MHRGAAVRESKMTKRKGSVGIAGSAPVSIGAVARLAGVSIATVSRVINGVPNRARPSTILRVQNAANTLGYRPQSVGRALRRQQSLIVGVLIANLANPAMAALATSIENALRSAGYVMVLCDTHERPEIQDEHLRELDAQLAVAVVLAVAVPSPGLDRLRAGGRGLVFVARRDPGEGAYPFVGIDDRAAGRQIGKVCAMRGEVPLVLHGSLRFSAGRARIAGLVEALKEAGLARNQRECCLPAPSLDHLQGGYEAMRARLEHGHRPPIVVAVSDLMAYGARRLLVENKADSATTFFSFDDNPLNDWVAPWLSAIHVPYDMYGTEVVRAIEAQVAGEAARDYILPHRLVLRGPGAIAGED